MTRLNLAISEEIRDRLEEIRDETRADSAAEVVRRALAVYDLLVSRQRAGAKIIIRDSESEREVILVP